MFTQKYLLSRAIFIISTLSFSLTLIIGVEWNSFDYGVVKVPVVDALGGNESDACPLKEDFNVLSCSPECGSKSCLRIHQLLANEIVRISQSNDYAFECELLNLVYLDKYDRNKYCKFWVLKDYICRLSDLKLSNVKNDITFQDIIADPFEQSLFNHNNQQEKRKCHIVTLVFPWFDPFTKKAYSVGTRFKRCKFKDNNKEYAVFVVDYSQQKVYLSYIPRDKVCKSGYDKKTALRAFLHTVKNWVTLNGKQDCAYLWGGCSYVYGYEADSFCLKSSDDEKQKAWHRPINSKHVSLLGGAHYAGFDCSSLISRAAQAAGLPYFFKNTTTACHNLKKLEHKIEKGDLIYYKGHIIVIVDVKQALVVEAAGYGIGYGKIHSTKLKNIFENIQTCTDLEYYYKHNKPLKRLNREGRCIKEITDYEILKIKSCWPKSGQ